ncbi:MAG: hypothetical protein ACD_76C00045G0013 [uncultured bacterium]|nr:MAG: hypothetical protein ACD_76C00045G0013 [uncultured bacterium]HBD05221.1 hypothetical protein [Candidatus Uhrbacteria bacterium]
MPKITLIIITGLPGTGKTTLGKKLAQDLNLPFINKDGIKEILFDNFGWKDRKWSVKIGGTSYDVLYYIVESMLKAGKSLVIESNFEPKFANRKLLDLKKKYNFTTFQIRCITDGKILFNRFKKRAKSKDRHPGHVDSKRFDEYKHVLSKGQIKPLKVGGKMIDLNTSDFSKVDYKKLLRTVKLATKINKL